MQTPNIEQLNRKFSLQAADAELRFENGKGDIPVVVISNQQASATISLQGAHVLSWIPIGEQEVIWVSDDAIYASGKSLRGGVPICWPWFGPHHSNASFPAHGFARTVMWQVAGTQQLSSGATQVFFKIDIRECDDQQMTKNGQHMWPQSTVAEYCITVGNTLTMELKTINQDDVPITIGQALHTYFRVHDVRNTKIFGLEDRDYLDKTDGLKRKTQAGAVTIGAEVDRVYLNTADNVIIDDGQRKILISKQGSHSTVVWNPWKAVAEKMGDLGKDGYLKMLCVESANAAEDTVTISPGDSHTLRVIYDVTHR